MAALAAAARPRGACRRSSEISHVRWLPPEPYLFGHDIGVGIAGANRPTGFAAVVVRADQIKDHGEALPIVSVR